MIGQEKEKFGGCKHLLPILKVREKHGNELCFDTYFMVGTFFPKIELPFPTFSMVVKNIHTFSKLKKKNIVFKVTSKFFSYCSFICCTLKMTLIRFLKEINSKRIRCDQRLKSNEATRILKISWDYSLGCLKVIRPSSST